METKLGTERNTPIKTNEIVDLIEERRKYKNEKIMKIKVNTKYIETWL